MIKDLQCVRLQRRLDYHLAADLPFQQAEILVLCETLSLMHFLSLNLIYLITYYE